MLARAGAGLSATMPSVLCICKCCRARHCNPGGNCAEMAELPGERGGPQLPDFRRPALIFTRAGLPPGPEYTCLEEAALAVRRAREAFNAWDDPEAKKRAAGVLRVMEEGAAAGQGQLLIRADDYPRGSRPAIRALLDAVQRS